MNRSTDTVNSAGSSPGSAKSVKSTASGSGKQKLSSSFRSSLGLKGKSKKKSDSESEDLDASKKKLKKGKLSKGAEEVSSSTETLDDKGKRKGSIGRKLSLGKLGKLGKKDKDAPSPPKNPVPSPPDSVTTTEDDYSDARSNVTLSALSDHSSATSLPPSVEEIETETEFLDAEKSSPDVSFSQSSTTLSEQMLAAENRTPTPVAPEKTAATPPKSPATPAQAPKTPNIKEQILSITAPVSAKRDSSPEAAKFEDKPTSPGQNGAKAGSLDKRELLFKILVIGELGTGKTSIIKRYVHQFFSQHYRATIGVDFALKILNYDPQTIIRLQLWDIAGQERFGNMTRVYYKEAVGAFIVFDVCRVATFEAVVKWKQDLDSKVMLPDGNPIPCILLANKCDQIKDGQGSNAAKMDEFCKEHKFAGWFETSAKDNINIEEAAKSLVTKILQNDSINHQNGKELKPEEKVALDNASESSKKSKCMC
ncbi:unnamed protein product [Bemisia tabaci]|uniref:Ras-related protein Rab-32 n=1 Tax=Bemisia tabaci TaxID=7038 RepID=A0A9P0EVQ8_BEMTA|nr:PREDICTED: ras-related protein Rab-33-like [Bemisia tabaci]CAH0381137.1 unnamed protein product [Bemisia tabaci]